MKSPHSLRSLKKYSKLKDIRKQNGCLPSDRNPHNAMNIPAFSGSFSTADPNT